MHKSLNDIYNLKREKLEKRQKQERNTLRYQRLVAACAKLTLEKNSKIFNSQDWDKISRIGYRKINKLMNIRVRNQMTTDIAKRDINQAIQALLLKRGIDEQKILDLIDKGENVAKSTRDYLAVADEYKQLLDINNNITIRKQQSIDYNQYVTDPDYVPRQTVTITETIKKSNDEMTNLNNDTSDNTISAQKEDI